MSTVYLVLKKTYTKTYTLMLDFIGFDKIKMDDFGQQNQLNS